MTQDQLQDKITRVILEEMITNSTEDFNADVSALMSSVASVLHSLAKAQGFKPLPFINNILATTIKQINHE